MLYYLFFLNNNLLIDVYLGKYENNIESVKAIINNNMHACNNE